MKLASISRAVGELTRGIVSYLKESFERSSLCDVRLGALLEVLGGVCNEQRNFISLNVLVGSVFNLFRVSLAFILLL